MPENDTDTHFRILVAGDFSGRAWRSQPAEALRPQPVDRDSLDDILRGMTVSIDINGKFLSISEIEDFHPDRICATLGVSSRQVNDVPAPVTPAREPRAPAAAGALLDNILAQYDEQNTAVSVEDANDLRGFIDRVTAGHLTRTAPSSVKEQEESSASETLRGILHDPRFQHLEAAWRALALLLGAFETSQGVSVYVLDATLPELIARRQEIKETFRAKGKCALIVGNYIFDQSPTHAAALQLLGGLAQSVGATFLAGSPAPDAGALSAEWLALRRSDYASYIGLLLPRFLLRLPYGKHTSSIDAFPFEEMPQSEHGRYLWGNSAFLAAYLIGQAYEDGGWDLKRVLQRRIDGLPMHVYRENGESVAKPCAEILMTESEAETLLGMGFMPVASLKDADGVLIVRYRSIADPPGPLAILS